MEFNSDRQHTPFQEKGINSISENPYFPSEAMNELIRVFRTEHNVLYLDLGYKPDYMC